MSPYTKRAAEAASTRAFLTALRTADPGRESEHVALRVGEALRRLHEHPLEREAHAVAAEALRVLDIYRAEFVEPIPGRSL